MACVINTHVLTFYAKFIMTVYLAFYLTSGILSDMSSNTLSGILAVYVAVLTYIVTFSAGSGEPQRHGSMTPMLRQGCTEPMAYGIQVSIKRYGPARVRKK